MLTTNRRTASATTTEPMLESRLGSSSPMPGGIGVDPPRHAHQARDVHREEGELEAEEDHPEGDLAEPSDISPAGELRDTSR